VFPLTETKLAVPAAGAEMDRLPRRLGGWSAAAVLVGSVIGSGIFRVPSAIAAEVGSVGAVMLIWIAGALVALFGALTLAELAAIYPRTGGIYVFLKETYGPVPAFLFGWTELLVIRPSALGAISMIFAEYLHYLIPADLQAFFPVRVVAATAIVLLALANIRSVSWGAAVQNVSTVAKVAALVGLALVAFIWGDGTTGSLASSISFAPLSWGGFGVALIAVLWAYDGWADLTFMAGEVRDPARTLPRALLGGTLAIVAIYLVVNLAYLYVLPVGEMAGSRLVATAAAEKIFMTAGASIVAAMVMLSAFGALNGSTMTGPRIFFAMADDGLFFSPFAAVHSRFRTPYMAIALAALLGVIYVSVRTFEQLADAFILGIWPFYVLAVGAVFILRRRHPDLERPYRTVGYPVIPLIFMLASLAMLVNALVRQPGTTLISFGIIVIGVPVYYLWRSLGGQRGARTRAPVE
jgi:amino acid transporter